MEFAPITITRTDNLISIAPVSYAPILGPHLTWQRQVRAPRGYGSKRGKPFYKTEEEPLFRLTDHELITFAGLRFKVYDLLKSYAPIAYLDERTPAWLFPQPCMENLGGFRHGQQAALETVWKSDGGIIDCSTGWGKSEEIAKICTSYHGLEDYPIIVVAPGKEILNNIVERLATYGIDAGLVDGSHNKRRQITVCSAFSLMKMEDNGDLSKARLCLFDEVHRCAATTIRTPLIRMSKARMFGFSATVEGRADNADIVIEALFGRRICTVTYGEAEKHKLVAPMHVIMVETEGPAMDIQDPTAKTRHGIWRNNARNQMFASVASQLVEMGQTLIITQTLEHAANIFKLLPPGWQLVYGNHPQSMVKTEKRKFDKKLENNPELPEGSFPKKPASLRRAERMAKEFQEMGLPPLSESRRKELAEQFKRGEIRGVVATGIWSTGVDYPGLQFVIRTEGSASEIQSGQTSGRGSRLSEAFGKSIGIVIDAEDKFDDSLARRRQSRVRVYQKNGWSIQRGARPEEVPTLCQQILTSSNNTI